jgi:hypothetical protein
MSENSVSCCLSAFALTLIVAMPAVATTKDVDDAIALLKEIRTDQPISATRKVCAGAS